MNKLATHMRITGLQVTNEDVDSRKAAISALKAAWLKSPTYEGVFARVSEIAAALNGDGTPPESLGQVVESFVQKKSSAFLYADRPLEVGIVAGMVATEILAAAPTSSGWTWADVWAASLWSALGFQPPLADEKREALRLSVLQDAWDRSIAGAESGRKRGDVPDFGPISLTTGEEAKLSDRIKTAVGPTIEALRRNAALDREELDFLWWAQLRRSRLLKRPLDEIDEVSRVVAAGVEGASLLRRMPCDVHREIVLRTISANPTVSLAGVLAGLKEDRAALVGGYGGVLPSGSETLFPLLSAISKGEAPDTPAAKLERTAEEWGTRALLEAALLKMMTSGPSKL